MPRTTSAGAGAAAGPPVLKLEWQSPDGQVLSHTAQPWNGRAQLAAFEPSTSLPAATPLTSSCSPNGEASLLGAVGSSVPINHSLSEEACVPGEVAVVADSRRWLHAVWIGRWSKLSVVSRKLGDDASKVKVLYVSVDPERDTPDVLKDDLGNFRIDAIGLTGIKAEIDKVVQQYGAAYEIVPTPDSAAKYTVSHTTTLYAVDPQGRLRMKFRYEATADEIVEGVKAILAAS